MAALGSQIEKGGTDVVQAPGVTVSSEGVLITPEGMAQIEQRHEGKQALLAEMRKEREQAYALKDSHIGVQLARDLGDVAMVAHTYHNFAAMANYCALAGKDAAGRTLASLANGLMRGAVEVFGKGVQGTIENYERVIDRQMRQDLGLEPKPSEDDDQGSSNEGAALIEGVVSQALGDPVPFIAPELEPTEAGDLDVAAIIRGDYVPDDQSSEPDDREPGSAMREAVSPEPDEDSPQRKAARLRREAKRLAQQGQGKALGQ